jgi:hypothetical protein
MTDEQIIKALERCGSDKYGFACEECPRLHNGIENERYCRRDLIISAHDLIKRQQAEIYNLKEDLSEYRNMPILTKNDCLIATVEKRADGKRYHNALLTIKVDEIRAEAYKEFAERLEYEVLHEDIEVNALKCRDYESFYNGANQFRYQTKGCVSRILKELTEGS